MSLKNWLKQGKLNDSQIKKAIEQGKLDAEEIINEGLITRERYNKLFYIPESEHMANIDNDQYPPDKIKKLIKDGSLTDTSFLKELFDTGKLDVEELLDEGVLTKQKYDQIYFVSADEHLRNIASGKYPQSKIRMLLKDGTVDEQDLLTYFNQYEIDEILQRPKKPFRVGGEWTDVPPLELGRIDVFVLGIAGSGKSTFMAGLMHYGQKVIGKIDMKIGNKSGFLYASKLTEAVGRGVLPPPTPSQNIQHLACTITDEEDKDHPLTFIEMSGEIFEQVLGKDQLPEKFNEYLFSENHKIFFFAIDYFDHSNPTTMLGRSQLTQFEYALKFFHENGTLNSTDALCLLVTKWDIAGSNDPAKAEEFLKKEYLNLVNLCKRYQRDYDLEFKVFTFSLGDFDARKSYTYDPRDSANVFKWLCNVSRYEQKAAPKPWWKKLFG